MQRSQAEVEEIIRKWYKVLEIPEQYTFPLLPVFLRAAAGEVRGNGDPPKDPL